MFPARGNPGNQFHVAAWAGKTPVPNGTDACRTAAAGRLVQSLTPFLIVASERTFFGYGWFYNLKDGYIPCKAGIECGMPNSWFPEFSKPLGEPSGPPTTETASHTPPYLRDCALARIVWDADSA